MQNPGRDLVKEIEQAKESEQVDQTANIFSSAQHCYSNSLHSDSQRVSESTCSDSFSN